MIEHRTGNLFSAPEIGTEKVLIPHVVNDVKAWGSGFVIAINQFSDYPRQLFLRTEPKLGTNTVCKVDSLTTVANMYAQAGISDLSTGPGPRNEKPIRYEHLVACMVGIRQLATIGQYKIICPEFGGLRAGGNWEFILELIEEIWCDIPTVVYKY